MTINTKSDYYENIETEKFLLGVANYRALNKLAKIFVGDSFIDRDEALVFIGEMEILCAIAFRHCLGNA